MNSFKVAGVLMMADSSIGSTAGWVDGLVESQKKIIQLVQNDPQISKKAMSQQIGISPTAVDKNITVLKEKGLLYRVGSDTGGYWEIIK